MKRLLTALISGVFISLGLFWLMQLMLTGNQQSVKKTDTLNMMEFVRLKRDPVKPKPQPKKPLPEKKALTIQGGSPAPKRQVQQEKPQPQKQVKAVVAKQIIPKMVTPKLDFPDLKTGSGPELSKPSFAGVPGGVKSGNSSAGTNNGNGKSGGTGQGKGQGKGAGASSGLIALRRVEPKYPARAMSRHIEGWVRVEFTVTTSGAVKNAHVAAAEPSGIFDDAALNAISQYMFKPEIAGGTAVERKGTQKFSFKLNN